MKWTYILLIAIVEAWALLSGYNTQISNTMPIFIPVQMSLFPALFVIFIAHSIALRSYLFKNQPDIFNQITNYSSLFGNGTYNVPKYYNLLFSNEYTSNVEISKRTSIIKTLLILIAVNCALIPINLLVLYLVNQ